jgi:hypothetical protein
MTDSQPESPPSASGPGQWDAGGLHFEVSFRAPAGATFRLFGPVEGTRRELFRFDDFVDSPHYHAPADGDPILFDRHRLGEPLDWLVRQIRHHLAELLGSAGFAAVLPLVDMTAASGSAERLRMAMIECVPDGYVRVPGVGLQRAGLAAG